MLKSSKTLRAIFSLAILLILATVILTVYRVWVAKDYNITFSVDCDPTIESCFVGEEDYNYKIANVKVKDIDSICRDGDIEQCDVPICEYAKCEYLLCGDPGSENYEGECSQ